MKAKTKVKIESLAPYRHLFPKAGLVDITIKKGASVKDTVHSIPEIIKRTKWQAKAYVDQELKGLSIYQACEKLWYFLKYHIEYVPDKRGTETVRTWRRLMNDAKGDCDCYTASIGTALSYFAGKGIRIINRITAYLEGFQHIYPIVILPDGARIVMDVVVENFNYEEPYSIKEDYEMDLQVLDGIEDTGNTTFSGNVDAEAFAGWNEMGDLGKLKLFKGKSSAMPGQDSGGKKKGFARFKEIAKKALNVTNKINPGTAPLRAGILASMKTNVMKVAGLLKWAYLSEDEARKKGADMNRFAKYKNILKKIESIFYTAGGNPENLKKAILSGHGNKHKEVNGLGLIDPSEIQFVGIDENTSIKTLLGEIYHDEFVNGLEGTEGLGVIATSAAIAAASTVMATIAALLKSVGSLFPKKAGEADSGGSEGNAGADSGGGDDTEARLPMMTTPSVSTSSGNTSDEDGGSSASPPATTNQSVSTNEDEDAGAGGENTNGTMTQRSENTSAASTGIKGFWEKNKKWAKPVGIGVVVSGVLYLGYRIVNKHNKEKERSAPNSGQLALAGFNKHNHKKKKKRKHKGGHNKKTPIALM
jgi:hypothetical protein